MLPRGWYRIILMKYKWTGKFRKKIPAVLSNLASCGWHLLLIISSHLFPWTGFRGHTILPLHWCLRVPSADRVNCMNGWSQGFALVSTRIVPSRGWHFPLWGLIHIPLACRRGVGAEGCAANQYEDNADWKVNLYFTGSNRSILWFSLFFAVKTITKLNLQHSDKFEKEN